MFGPHRSIPVENEVLHAHVSEVRTCGPLAAWRSVDDSTFRSLLPHAPGRVRLLGIAQTLLETKNSRRTPFASIAAATRADRSLCRRGETFWRDQCRTSASQRLPRPCDSLRPSPWVAHKPRCGYPCRAMASGHFQRPPWVVSEPRCGHPSRTIAYDHSQRRRGSWAAYRPTGGHVSSVTYRGGSTTAVVWLRCGHYRRAIACGQHRRRPGPHLSLAAATVPHDGLRPRPPDHQTCMDRNLALLLRPV